VGLAEGSTPRNRYLWNRIDSIMFTKEDAMARATAHPDHQCISSEDSGILGDESAYVVFSCRRDPNCVIALVRRPHLIGALMRSIERRMPSVSHPGILDGVGITSFMSPRHSPRVPWRMDERVQAPNAEIRNH
jgi:hypothetical protein